MLIEAIFVLAIAGFGFILLLDKFLYPRRNRLFRAKPRLVKLAGTLLPVLVIVFVIRAFSFESFQIPSNSMQPTLAAGDLVLVDKFSLGLRLPLLGTRLTKGSVQRGDIVVFRANIDGKPTGVIKRVVGLPGDKLKYRNRTLYVNGIPAVQFDINSVTRPLADGSQEKLIQATEDLDGKRHQILLGIGSELASYPYDEITVSKGSYFVLGDYRSNSYDSRFFGLVSDSKLVGKARLIAFSMDWPTKTIRWNRLGRII